jgi:hypothetical protein
VLHTQIKFGSKCQFGLSFCGLVYISIRIPAYPSTDGERQIGNNFESSDHDTIVVVSSQNKSEDTYHVHKKPNNTNLLILNFHDYRFFRDGIQYLV